jgi:NAD(P)-dependent dehydrogenase (short-subunit alcohol dehydrogenase family)
MRLSGRVATVTGSGRGMGEAIARAFAREGAAVVVNDIDLAGAERVAAEIREAGGKAHAIRIDVGDDADAERLAQTAVDVFGGLDIHVNNAGISQTRLFTETTRADLDRILRVNLVGAFICAQAAARVMLQRSYGRIINIASLSGQRGGVGRAAYGVSKAGLEMLTKVMSVELAARGITVNNIAPGAIATQMAVEQHDKATRDAYHYLIPQRRYGTPEEIADAAVFLASDEAKHICGHTLNVDGGYLTAGLMFSLGDSRAPDLPKI